MRTKLNCKKIFKASLIVLIALTAGSQLNAHEKAPLKDFKLVIVKTAGGIKMQGLKGSAWTELSFDLNNDRPQAIDEYGMTVSDKVSPDKDPNLSDFLFTITRTRDGIVLEGFEGTAWKELSFSLAENSSQVIDQLGMSTNN